MDILVLSVHALNVVELDDTHRLPGHIARLLARKVGNQVGDVLGLTDALHGHGVGHLRGSDELHD